jgi:threonine dehydrogenase-like Zn-dependent dehydrogenase
MPIEHAALAEPIAVSWHAVRLGMERLRIPLAAACVVVLGGGAIGLAAAIVARHFGATRLCVGETNPLRRDALHRAENIETFTPDSGSGPADNSADLVIDAVGAAGSRAAASRLVRPGGIIVHLGLLPGADGLDIRKVTLQEITFMGSYCYTPADFRHTVAALVAGQLGKLRWFEERPLSEGAGAFASIDAGSTAAAKIILRP